MRRFLGSAWFPLFICLVLAGVSAGAYKLSAPTGESVGNSEIVHAFGIAAWAAGGVAAVLSFLLIGVLNLLRRLFRVRRVGLFHPLVIILGLLPVLIFMWEVAGEPPYTAFARAAVIYIARPVLQGTLAAILATLVLSIPLLFRKKK